MEMSFYTDPQRLCYPSVVLHCESVTMFGARREHSGKFDFSTMEQNIIEMCALVNMFIKPICVVLYFRQI